MVDKDFIDPNSEWALKHFPDAVDPATVGWMVVEWAIMYEPNKCKDCGGNYSLFPDQFNDIPISKTRAEAVEIFRRHKRNRRQNIPKGAKDNRRTTLFLLKVVKYANITDDDRNLLADDEVDV